MNFKSFTFQVCFRLMLIIGFAIVSIHLLTDQNYRTTSALLLIISGLLTYSLVSYLNRVNRDLTRFTLAIKNNDFQENFTKPSNKSYKDLYDAFNQVIDQFLIERGEKEDRYYILQTVIEHIKIGLLSFNESGEIDIYNNAARKLFSLPYLRNISELEQFDKSFVDKIRTSEINKKHLISAQKESKRYKLSFEIIEFKKNYETFRLVSIQDIKEELDQNELESWQKLIRVLNHEIFNSITPIISLSETTKEFFNSDEDISKEDFNDIEQAFFTIEKRSKHLLEFVNQFRSITHLPKPVFKICLVRDLVHDVLGLFKSELNEKNIEWSVSILPETLEVSVDVSMLEQVLINILKNAIEAMGESPEKKLHIISELFQNRPLIKIIDSGEGIATETLDKLFIPFFTTKKTGTGIGLSLSKQLIKLNNGDIKILSTKGETEVTLYF